MASIPKDKLSEGSSGLGPEDMPGLTQLRGSIEDEITRLADRLRVQAGPADDNSLLLEPLASLLASGGKRLRPLLMVTAYLGWSREVTKPLVQASAALEIMHAFALIHDDITDKADERRGDMTLHRRYAADAYGDPTSNRGVSMAMVAGDLLFAHAVDIFLDACGYDRGGIAALRLLLRAATQTARGQFDEIARAGPGALRMPEEAIWRTYDLKTGHYSFQAPMSAGATLAGAPQTGIEGLSRAGMHLGRAYQALDDLEDLTGGPGDAPAQFADLRNGVVTVPVHRLYGRCGKEGVRRHIDDVLTRQNPSLQSCKVIGEWVRRYGIDREIRGDSALQYRAAFEHVDSAGCSEHCRSLLTEIAGALFETAHVDTSFREAT